MIVLPTDEPGKAPEVLPVSVLNRLSREVLERSFSLLWVSGEISNLTHAASGHVYFSLKDETAQVRCVMFRNRAQLLPFRLHEGLHVEARALVTLYEARGDFQLNVEALRHAGIGALYEAYARLREKLDKEGLFDAARKRALPIYPRRIGIVTSLQAAALRDVLAALHRRSPQVPVVIYPVPVQGEGAAEKIATAIRLAGTRAECNTLIVTRGGGSIEDLWAFNEEVVARAIATSSIPVIVGVGHETDVTIADFAADHRAATPTAAAELASAGYVDARTVLRQLGAALRETMRRRIETRMQRLDLLSRSLLHPGERMARIGAELAHARSRLNAALRLRLAGERNALQNAGLRLTACRPDFKQRQRTLVQLKTQLASAMTATLRHGSTTLNAVTNNLAHLNPASVLGRGYSITRNARGDIVRNSEQLTADETISIAFAQGWAHAQITKKGRQGASNE